MVCVPVPYSNFELLCSLQLTGATLLVLLHAGEEVDIHDKHVGALGKAR